MYNIAGELVQTENIYNHSFGSFSSPDVSGLYTLKIEYLNYLGEKEIIFSKLICQ